MSHAPQRKPDLVADAREQSLQLRKSLAAITTAAFSPICRRHDCCCTSQGEGGQPLVRWLLSKIRLH